MNTQPKYIAKERYTAKGKRVGRPPKDKHGEMVWIPSECLDFVKTYLETIKQKTKSDDNA